MVLKYLLFAWVWIIAIPPFVCAQTSILTPLTIDEATTPIRIDGHLDDWPTSRLFHLYRKNQVTSGAPFWKDDDNFSGRIFITYNAQYLYLAAIVTKLLPIVNDGAKLSLMNGDCVELLLSTEQSASRRNRLSRGAYHLGFSPGTNCKFPSLYCFNMDKEITGGRIAVRKDPKGYVLEACIPLTFLEGLDLGPGKKAAVDVVLDEGGSLSGNRIVRMDMSHDDLSASHPGKWTEIQWTGKDALDVPFSEGSDLNGDLVLDGTAGDTFRGSRPVTGCVLDEKGNRLEGATVSTWPRTGQCLTDSTGHFVLPKIKIYDQTLVYARQDGYFSSLAPYQRNSPVTVRLRALPEELIPETGKVSRTFLGSSLQSPPEGLSVPPVNDPSDDVKQLSLKFLDLSGLDPKAQTLEQMEGNLDLFESYCEQVGCIPLIRLPLPAFSREAATVLVAHAKEMYPGKMQYWALGDEPDRLEGINDDPSQTSFNVYRYINEFRTLYNAMKLIDPGIIILGPELAYKYTHDENDWLTPFLRYNGDIVNLASIHRFAFRKSYEVNDKSVLKILLEEPALIRGLEDRVEVNTEVTIPLVVTGGNVFAEVATLIPTLTPTPTATSALKKISTMTVTPTPTPYPISIWPALWAAQETGILMNGGIPMVHFSTLSGNPALDAMVSGVPGPLYWAMKMMAPHLKGKVLSAQTRMSNLYVFASEEESTRTVNLFIVNTGDRYLHPRISLSGGDEDVSVISDISIETDFEVPEMGAARLTLRADGKPGESEIYFYKSALNGTPSVIHPFSP